MASEPRPAAAVPLEPEVAASAPRWVHTRGTSLVDEHQLPLTLTGIVSSNEVWGSWHWPKSDELAAKGVDPLFRPTEIPAWVLTDADFSRLSRLPGNAVRYEIAHEQFAEENPKRASNLAVLQRHIAHFAQIGKGVILDLQMPIGLDVQSDNYERKKAGSKREPSLFESDEYYSATERLWKFLASELATLPTLLGYELFNEPRVPSEAQGGLARYQQLTQQLARAVRSVDARHLILVPEYNSREVSPGETYPDPNGGRDLVDHGEQGVRWDHGFVVVDCPNIAYVLHMYHPWAFTGAGGNVFAEAEVKQAISERVLWRDSVGHAPLIATEYGVNWQHPVQRRLAWLRLVHDTFVANGISATFFNYKIAVNPWVDPAGQWALYGQFLERNQLGVGLGDQYRLRADAQKVAAKTGFDTLFRKWFVTLSPQQVSLLDHEPIVRELARFSEQAAAMVQ